MNADNYAATDEIRVDGPHKAFDDKWVPTGIDLAGDPALFRHDADSAQAPDAGGGGVTAA